MSGPLPELADFPLGPQHCLQWDPTKHVDFRGEAIVACDVWERARNEFLRGDVTRCGLLRTSRLVALARSLEPSMTPVKPEHPDAHVARLACLDWIAYTVGRHPALTTKKGARFLGRFMWGYLENTKEFDSFFQARKSGSPIAAPRLASLPSTRQCFIGCVYGAPTLGAMMRGTGGVRGRGRWPAIFIDDEAYAVLAKNKAASHLMHLESLVRGRRRDETRLLRADIADQLVAMSDLEHPETWPAFIVQRAGGPRLALHLAIGRRGAAGADLGSDPQWWLRIDGSLLELLTERQRRNFESKATNGEWGTFEQLLWHLTVVRANARTHRDLFSHLPTAVL